jgi:hypothetical protein
VDWGFLDIVWQWIMGLGHVFRVLINELWGYIWVLKGWIEHALSLAGDAIVWVGQHLWRGIKALRKINFKHLWHKLKRAWTRFQKALEWYRKHVQEPIDRMRRQVWAIYRALFKPVIMFLDTFRPIIRVIGLFDRKLAAKLDHRLMALEGKLLWPITAILHRLNAFSSYFTALITTAGKLARPLLLESMRRDALLVWEVLTNPRALLYSPPERVGPPSLPSVEHDFREYLEQATGPYTMHEAEARDALRQGFEEAA